MRAAAALTAVDAERSRSVRCVTGAFSGSSRPFHCFICRI